MLSESSAPSKLRLVQYFFLDLAHSSPPDQLNDLVDNLVKFPSAFSLPPSLIKLTQAFWLLDHEDWEEGVSMMLDPLLQESCISYDHIGKCCHSLTNDHIWACLNIFEEKKVAPQKMYKGSWKN